VYDTQHTHTQLKSNEENEEESIEAVNADNESMINSPDEEKKLIIEYILYIACMCVCVYVCMCVCVINTEAISNEELHATPAAEKFYFCFIIIYPTTLNIIYINVCVCVCVCMCVIYNITVKLSHCQIIQS